MNTDITYRHHVCEETRRRIRVSVWAYAYEILGRSMVSDDVFDAECRKIDLSVNTYRPDMDLWFRQNFNACTGMWIHSHPEIQRIAQLAKSLQSR